MPRINLEDAFFTDPRVERLHQKVGESYVTLCLIAFRLAQHYWLPDKELIPLKSWTGSGLGEELIEVGMAEKRETGIYVSGTEKHFAWWFRRQEAGRRGGTARAANAKQTKANPSKPKQGQPSSSSSSSEERDTNSKQTTDVRPISSDASAFNRFWKDYPKKVGKKAAAKAWERAKINGNLEAVLAAVRTQLANPKWQEEGGRFIPNPATWINQGRWDDEPTTIGKPRPAPKPRTSYDDAWDAAYDAKHGGAR